MGSGIMGSYRNSTDPYFFNLPPVRTIESFTDDELIAELNRRRIKREQEREGNSKYIWKRCNDCYW